MKRSARVTYHGGKRMRERIGVPKRAIQKLADTALEKGVRHKDTAGSLKKYISTLYLQYETANNIRLYGDKVYLFAGSILITVLQIPPRYVKIVKAIKDKKENSTA